MGWEGKRGHSQRKIRVGLSMGIIQDTRGPKINSYPLVIEARSNEDSWESLALQGDQTVNPKGNQSWKLIGRTDAELKLQYFGYLMQRANSLEKTLMLVRLRAGGEGDNRGWDGWMASPTRWTWVWASSRKWWWTGKPGVLQPMGSQRVGHDWATELNCVQTTHISSKRVILEKFMKLLLT